MSQDGLFDLMLETMDHSPKFDHILGQQFSKQASLVLKEQPRGSLVWALAQVICGAFKLKSVVPKKRHVRRSSMMLQSPGGNSAGWVVVVVFFGGGGRGGWGVSFFFSLRGVGGGGGRGWGLEQMALPTSSITGGPWGLEAKPWSFRASESAGVVNAPALGSHTEVGKTPFREEL